MINRITTLMILLSGIFLYTSCSIPASCEPGDYTGDWSGELDCEIVGDSDVFLEVFNNNGILTANYNDIEMTGGIDGCFLEVSGEASPIRSVEISGTILLGNLSLNVNEVFLGDTIQFCSGNLN